MNLLLLSDIDGIGLRHTVQEVDEKRALNELLPQRRALVATPTVLKRYAPQIELAARRGGNLAKYAAERMAERNRWIDAAITAGRLPLNGIQADLLREQFHILMDQIDALRSAHPQAKSYGN